MPHKLCQTRLLPVWLLVLLMLTSQAQADDRHMEIIPLKHRPAESLIPSLQPLTSGNTSLSAVGNKLIIKASPSDILQLKTLIEELDTPLAQFRISVRSGNQSNIRQYETGFEHQGPNVTSTPTIKRSTNRDGVTIHSETRRSSSKVIVHRNSSLNSNNAQQQVRATEGYPAYIHIGKEVPVSSLIIWDAYDNVGVTRDYKPVISGFYVVPQLSNDDYVVLSLSTQKQSLGNNRQINTQGYQGTVRGRLGEWIQVGGLGQQDNQRETSLNRHYSSNVASSGNLYLMVERVY
ncbi:MAG: secretin N-terminal domain-containing protein [Candidatus Pelagadaptatus aseana]|uniref:secretin N-terminal domain-containing protein n=1 Tax=Candidatus Pelagadaptatus aseana TaxID=3120508 RepID=UPI0039B1FEBB